MLKKVAFVFLVSIFVLGITGSPFANAASKNEGNGLTAEQMELSQTVITHLEASTDEDGNKELRITEPEDLETALSENDLISYEQLVSVVSQFNQYMASGDNNIVTETVDDIAKQLKNQGAGQMGTMAVSCGDALTAIGFVHAGSYSAAACLLGITGPAAVIVPLLVSAVYAIASIACE